MRATEFIVEEMAGEKNKCPPATQDITLNLKNRQKAIDEYGYGPLNPDMPNRKFWMKKVDEWNLDSIQEAQQSLCGNCAAFDIRQETLDCIAQGIDSGNPQDAQGVIDAGDLGYCKFLKFKCASRRTCDAWVTGGPLVDKQGMAEGGAETSWSNDTGTITLQDILELTKHIKQINLPINDNLKSKLLNWEGNPEEIERVNQVTVSNQFPILIMVDEQGQIAWILDGNHRLHKAIQSQAKTIPAKLIKPSNLNDKAKKIFNIKEQGVAEGLNFDEIYGKYLKVTDNNGDPGKPGFSLVTPLNGDSWNWRERPEFKDLVKQKLNDPGFLGAHKYQQIIDAMSGKQFDPTKHIAKENFHDGRNPQDKGDSKRHGVPTKASISTLRKVAKQGGRKGQLAHWMANMRRGRAKKH